MGEELYMHSVTSDDVELSRLTLQASVIDPVTIRHLALVGVAEDWKCLEVGAGSGSIAQWLSTRVGPTGKVVATDIDTRFLLRLGASNLEVRKHDILKDDLEEGQYDLVHCRFLLVHLREPVKALKRMSEAVRPGGWLLIEEDDWGSMMCADVSGDPSSIFLAAACRASNDFVRKRGIADPYFGRRVRGLVDQLGYMDVGQEGWTMMVRGGDPMADVIAGTWQASVRARIPAGDITREEADRAYCLLLDPAFYYPSFTVFSAWGRKPAAHKQDTVK